MNALDVLKYGHLEVERAVAPFEGSRWEEPGVVGTWSAKDVIGHLAAFEWVLLDATELLAGREPETPYLDAFRGSNFNDSQAEQRRRHSPDDVLAEYREAYERVMASVSRLAPERMRKDGTMPWYGAEYSFDDLVVYQYYGHKREHCAQLAASVSGDVPRP